MNVSRQEVLDNIFALLDRILPKNVAASERTGLVDELGLNSSAALYLLLELEESLDVHFSVDDFYTDGVKTIGDLADLIVATGHPNVPESTTDIAGTI